MRHCTGLQTLSRWLRQLATHLPVVLAGLLVAWTGSLRLGVLWFAASRIAYVLYVGLTLAWVARHGPASLREGPEKAWLRFRSISSWLMDNDAVAFGALCVVSLDSFAPVVPRWVPVAAGAVLFAVGVGVKTWAAASLDSGAYHWRNFFVPRKEGGLSAAGPYRWLKNPMYTLGYAHAYGFALAFCSGPGLLAAAFAQALMLTLNQLVERPHLPAAAAEESDARDATR